MLLIAGAGCSSGSGGSPAPGAASDPPPGQVEFGDSFDSSTGILYGTIASARVGQNVSFLATFSQSLPEGPLMLGLGLNGEILNIQQIEVPHPPWIQYGGDLPAAALTQPGQLVLVFNDSSGNQLAGGVLTILP
jgi:hypothetical protein